MLWSAFRTLDLPTSAVSWKGVDDLEITKVTPIWKAVDSSNISNSRPTSVLPCFSMPLENLYIKLPLQVLKRKQHSLWKTIRFSKKIHHPINWENFLLFSKKKQCTLGVFIDFSKELDTFHHSISLKKLKLYGITAKVLHCLKVTFLIESSTFI